MLKFTVAAIAAILSMSAANAQNYVPDQFLVMTSGANSNERLAQMNRECGTAVERELLVMARGKWYLVHINDGRTVPEAIACWKQFPEVEHAAPNFGLNLND